MKYPDGNTYSVSLEEIKLLLKQLGVPELKAEKFLDKLWNFYALRLDLKTHEWDTLPAPEYPDHPTSRPLEPWDWVIEPGKVR